MKILTVIGTRPEIIKMAPVIKALEERPDIESKICLTSQHKEMAKPLIDFFNIHCDYDLNVMRQNQSLHEVASAVLTALPPILLREKPDWVLVQGDTATTLSAALSAYYCRMKIGHVEAGLRTGDKHNPFPEEINRRLTDHVSDMHFVATQSAKTNLLAEGIPETNIIVTGNTVIDALYMTLERLNKSTDARAIEASIVSQVHTSLSNKRIILATVHRRESIGVGLTDIFKGLRQIAESFPDCLVIYPVHLNPNVRRQAFDILAGVERVHLLEPLDYPTFVWLMSKAYLVLTDSGGLQEEAPALGKPILVLRDKTERPEIIESGVGKLIGTKSDIIYKETARLLVDKEEYQSMARGVSPFGDGHATARILEALMKSAN